MIDGKFSAVATGFALGESKEKKTPFVRIKFKIVNHPSLAGELVPWDGWLNSEKNAERTFKALRVAGWKGTQIGGDLVADGLGSQVCSIVVEGEPYDGKVYYRVKWVNAFDDGSVRLGEGAMPAASKDDFSARFASIAEGCPLVEGPDADEAITEPTQAAQRQGGYPAPEGEPPMMDDDLPF